MKITTNAAPAASSIAIHSNAEGIRAAMRPAGMTTSGFPRQWGERFRELNKVAVSVPSVVPLIRMATPILSRMLIVCFDSLFG